MNRSTRSFLIDVNVWIALAYDLHVHHSVAVDWFEALDNSSVFYCRSTHVSFLRLLTNEHVMGPDALSQRNAWKVLDRTVEDPRFRFLPEPAGVEKEFRRLTQSHLSLRNQWPDAYVAAVAVSAGLTLATLDRGLRSMPGVSVLCLAG
jgi:uncharacterized protein